VRNKGGMDLKRAKDNSRKKEIMGGYVIRQTNPNIHAKLTANIYILVTYSLL